MLPVLCAVIAVVLVGVLCALRWAVASRPPAAGFGWVFLCASCKQVCPETAPTRPFSTETAPPHQDDVSHSICPACVRKLYPELADKVLGSS
jgi:hypothetical protein